MAPRANVFDLEFWYFIDEYCRNIWVTTITFVQFAPLRRCAATPVTATPVLRYGLYYLVCFYLWYYMSAADDVFGSYFGNLFATA